MTLDQVPVGIGAMPGDKRWKRLVAEKEQLTGARIKLRMRRHRTIEAIAKPIWRNGFQRSRRELLRQPALPKRKQPIRITDDIGVGGILERTLGTYLFGNLSEPAEQRLARAHLSREPRGFHIA